MSDSIARRQAMANMLMNPQSPPPAMPSASGALANALLGLPQTIGNAFTNMATQGLMAHQDFLDGRGADGEDLYARPLLPNADNGGRLGAMASFLNSNMAFGGPAGSLGAGISTEGRASKAAGIASRAANALPMDEASRLARAEGWVDVYHGTTQPNIQEFQSKIRPNEQLGFGTHVTTDPSFASEYAIGAAARKGPSPNVMPLKADLGNVFDATQIVKQGTPEFDIAKKLAGSRLFTQKDEFGVPSVYLQSAIDSTSPARAKKILEEAGYNSVKYKAQIKQLEGPGRYTRGAEAESYTILNPANLRSRFAAFDPARRNESDLLASYGPNPFAAALLGQPQE